MKVINYLETAVSYLANSNKRKLIRVAGSLRGKKGLEIGGPSSLFSLRGYFPIYIFAKQIDGINFSNETVWEGKLEEGPNYKYFQNNTGYQYIAEATDLSKIAESSYDFVLSCHSLEHIANPIKAIKEWFRILKPSGSLVVILPDKENTFDINRPYTTLKHLIKDYDNNVDEKDDTHFTEVIELHEFSKETFVRTREELIERTSNNFANRCVHHHVFSLSLIKDLLEHCGFSVTHQQKGEPFHLITIAEKRVLR